jgi:hypothetical protein
MNLPKISIPVKGIMKIAPKGENAVITAAAAAAVITGGTAVSVLKDVYNVHLRRPRCRKNKGGGAPVPSPENDDIVDDSFIDDTIIDPAQNA